MSKLANPWKCDNPACGILRANDTNHWLVIALVARVSPVAHELLVTIQPWSDEAAQRNGSKHACGIDCGLKIAAQLIVENFYPHDLPASSPGKEGSYGGS